MISFSLRFLVLLVATVSIVSLAGNAPAEDCGTIVRYDGKGAGNVVFDGPFHVAKGLTCADCHEHKGFSFALFTMKKGDNPVSMRQIEMGRSCGRCHPVTMTDMSSCDTCHKK